MSGLRRTAVIAVAGSLLVSACSSNSEGGGPTGSVSNTISTQKSAAAFVPANIKKAGKLIVGVNVPYSPNEYISKGKVVGFDVDLMDAVAKSLGLKTDYRQADFEKIVPSVKAGTYSLGMSSFTDNKMREQTDDFVDYFSAGFLWAQRKGGSVDPTNACGLTVAVQATTVEQTDELPRLNKLCKTAGKPAIKPLPYESQDDATNAVVLGKAVAMIADSPVTAYAIKQSSGKLVQAGKIVGAAPYGWAVKKGSSLAKALQMALQSLIDAGTYDQICKKWGVQSGEIKTAMLNGAQS